MLCVIYLLGYAAAADADGDVADGGGAAGVLVHHLHLGLQLPALVVRLPAPTVGTMT